MAEALGHTTDFNLPSKALKKPANRAAARQRSFVYFGATQNLPGFYSARAADLQPIYLCGLTFELSGGEAVRLNDWLGITGAEVLSTARCLSFEQQLKLRKCKIEEMEFREPHSLPPSRQRPKTGQHFLLLALLAPALTES